MDYFTFKGTEENLKSKVSELMPETESQVFIDNIEKIIEFLDDDEYVEKRLSFPESRPGSLLFLVPKTNYNINIKAITVATLALLFDIKLTYGILSAFLGLTGFNSHSIILLNEIDGEKCLVIEALRNKRIVSKEVFSNYNYKCANNRLNCKYKNEETCNIEKTDIEKILDVLCDKNVFTKTGGKYKYNF